MRPVRDDEGFSLLEVLFASFIAFFILTALFGVLVTSATQGRFSRTDIVATNLAQRCIEQARSMPYENVGIVSAPSGQVEGVLPSQEQTTYENVDFTIKREVVWVADPLNVGGDGQDYKQLSVIVTDGKTRGAHVATYIRDQKNESLPGPIVEFVEKPDTVRPPNPVVFVDGTASKVWNGVYCTGAASDKDNCLSGPPSIQASASIEATSGKVVRIEFLVGNTVIGTPWTGAERNPPVYPTDPMPINLSQETTAGPVFTEGANIVRAVATANNLGTGSDMVILTLDNDPGYFISGAQLTYGAPDWNADVYRGGVKLKWPIPMDGNEVVPYYDLGIAQGSSAGTTLSLVALGDSGAYTLGPPAPASVATVTPFAYYTMRLRTRSARGLPGNVIVNDKILSPPRTDGIVENTAPDKWTPDTFRISLSLTQPGVGVPVKLGGTSILYDVYSMEASSYAYPGYGDLPAEAYMETWDKTRPALPLTGPTIVSFAPKNNSCNKYFQVEARVMSGTTVVMRVRGNVVGPQPATGPPKYNTNKVLPIPGVSP